VRGERGERREERGERRGERGEGRGLDQLIKRYVASPVYALSHVTRAYAQLLL
jgi:hypothetical protein